MKVDENGGIEGVVIDQRTITSHELLQLNHHYPTFLRTFSKQLNSITAYISN
jgi:hypothetical protein